MNGDTLNNCDLIGKKKQHADSFFTKRFLHAARFAMSKLNNKEKAGGVFYLYELDNVTRYYPCGLTSGGYWRSNGQEGMYKTPVPAKVKRVFYIKLGSKGNMSDDNSIIMLVRDGCEMGNVLSVDLKLDELGKHALNRQSGHYNAGAFNLDGEDSDDESIGQELSFVEGVLPPDPNQNNTVDESLAKEIKTSLIEAPIEKNCGQSMTAKLSLTTVTFSREANVVLTLNNNRHRRTLKKAVGGIIQMLTTQDIPCSKVSIETNNHHQFVTFFGNMKFHIDLGSSQLIDPGSSQDDLILFTRQFQH